MQTQSAVTAGIDLHNVAGPPYIHHQKNKIEQSHDEYVVQNVFKHSPNDDWFHQMAVEDAFQAPLPKHQSNNRRRDGDEERRKVSSPVNRDAVGFIPSPEFVPIFPDIAEQQAKLRTLAVANRKLVKQIRNLRHKLIRGQRRRKQKEDIVSNESWVEDLPQNEGFGAKSYGDSLSGAEHALAPFTDLLGLDTSSSQRRFLKSITNYFRFGILGLATFSVFTGSTGILVISGALFVAYEVLLSVISNYNAKITRYEVHHLPKSF